MGGLSLLVCMAEDEPSSPSLFIRLLWIKTNLRNPDCTTLSKMEHSGGRDDAALFA